MVADTDEKIGKGQVESYLQSELRDRGTLLFVLIDSEVSNTDESARLVRAAESAGASAILVGGSSATDQMELSVVTSEIKKSTQRVPVILFPGNVTGVVPSADAILFSSLLNSENPYFVTQAQALGAPSVAKFGLEPLPTAYLVIGEGTTAWFVGGARGIPHDKPKIAAAYSLAAQFLGMRFVYLEAGSGAKTSVSPEMVRDGAQGLWRLSGCRRRHQGRRDGGRAGRGGGRRTRGGNLGRGRRLGGERAKAWGDYRRDRQPQRQRPQRRNGWPVIGRRLL